MNPSGHSGLRPLVIAAISHAAVRLRWRRAAHFALRRGCPAADGEIWKTRRRAIVPSLHRAYIAAMIEMFGDCTLHATKVPSRAIPTGTSSRRPPTVAKGSSFKASGVLTGRLGGSGIAAASDAAAAAAIKSASD